MRSLIKHMWAWRKMRWAMILALPAMMIFSVVGVELSSTSTFCNSCHIMNSFHDSWAVSSHKDVECIQCHIPPGITNLVSAKLNGLGQAVDDILERTGTQPSANVSDASCTREGCHDVAKIQALPKIEKPFFFVHAKHFGREYQGIKIHCTTCHSHIKGDKHFEVNAGVCVTCHLLKTAPGAAPVQLAAADAPPVQTVDLKASAPAPAAAAPTIATAPTVAAGHPATPTTRCRDCHQPPAEPVMYRGLKVVHAEYVSYGAACESCHRGVTAAPGPIADDRCLGCHDFGRERIKSVSQLHEEHSSGRHKIECFSCHGLIWHGPSAQTMRLDQIDCRACHLGQHQVQQETYRYTGQAADVHQQPADSHAVTPMFMAHVDCTGCHTQSRAVTDKRAAGATVAVASAKACDACHTPGLGDQMIPLWQKNTRTLYDSVERMLPDPAKPLPSPKAEQLIRDARQFLTLVRLDGSWGVHNPPYTQKLIERAREKIQEALGIAAVSSAPPAPALTTAPAQ